MSSMEHARAENRDAGISASSGGVQARKWVSTTGSGVPVVRYEFASTRGEPVVLVVLAVAAVGYWWYLHQGDLAPDGDEVDVGA